MPPGPLASIAAVREHAPALGAVMQYASDAVARTAGPAPPAGPRLTYSPFADEATVEPNSRSNVRRQPKNGIGESRKSVAAALAAATARSPAELSAMGTRGAEWIARDFTWPAIAARLMHALYRTT